MDHLWAPWRQPYLTGETGAGGQGVCVFCDAPNLADESSLIVHHGREAYVIVNRFPYNIGHVMVLPYRHVSALNALSLPELHEIAELTQRAEAVLTEAYTPSGLNVGINLGRSSGAGLRDHLHVHLVPRWTGDTNLITVVSDTRVLSEELPVTATRLRALWTSR